MLGCEGLNHLKSSWQDKKVGVWFFFKAQTCLKLDIFNHFLSLQAMNFQSLRGKQGLQRNPFQIWDCFHTAVTGHKPFWKFLFHWRLERMVLHLQLQSSKRAMDAFELKVILTTDSFKKLSQNRGFLLNYVVAVE